MVAQYQAQSKVELKSFVEETSEQFSMITKHLEWYNQREALKTFAVKSF